MPQLSGASLVQRTARSTREPFPSVAPTPRVIQEPHGNRLLSLQVQTGRLAVQPTAGSFSRLRTLQSTSPQTTEPPGPIRGHPLAGGLRSSVQPMVQGSSWRADLMEAF